MKALPPAWLEAFQARFGDVLRAPLDRATGTLTPVTDAYDRGVVESSLDGSTLGGAERLAVYNRQYWCRLFDVLHGAFPLVCRLLGYWSFNAFAGRYLLAHPPRGWDLDDMPEAFPEWFTSDLDAGTSSLDAGVDARALVEAARIDAAFRAVFRAPDVPVFRPGADDAAHLPDARLTPSPAAVIVVEHTALLDLRRAALKDTTERSFPFPPAWPAPRSVALFRAGDRTVEAPLEPMEAELLHLLRDHPVRDALARIERACPDADRASLPERTRAWLARSVERGWWTGMVRAQPQTTQL